MIVFGAVDRCTTSPRHTCSMYLPTGCGRTACRTRPSTRRPRAAGSSMLGDRAPSRSATCSLRALETRCDHRDQRRLRESARTRAIERLALRLQLGAQLVAEVAEDAAAYGSPGRHEFGCARPRSSVDLAEDGIERTDHHDHVGDELAERDLLERLQVVHRRRTRAHALRPIVAVGDDVVAEFAARPLDRPDRRRPAERGTIR